MMQVLVLFEFDPHAEMDTSTDKQREYQAEVHFALGTIIQGVTLAALGNEVAGMMRDVSLSEAGWIIATAVQSLFLCILFWYRFMDNYHSGFRMMRMTAGTHFMIAVLHILLGLQQLVAIHFLDTPRLWLTLYVLLIATTLAGSWISTRILRVQDHQPDQADDPASWPFLLTFFITLVLLVAWYVLPGSPPDVLGMAALFSSAIGILLFAVYSIQLFKGHQLEGK
jgi:hypothetical protein